MDLAPTLLICTPIFLPAIKTFGIDPVHFGIIIPAVGPTMVVGCHWSGEHGSGIA